VGGPKGIPEPIVQKLQAVFKRAMEDPEHNSKMGKAGLTIKPMVGDEYAKFLRDIHERARTLTDEARKAR
jgi:tripartite-type tricarboxylate transporter receptor subunit TctC